MGRYLLDGHESTTKDFELLSWWRNNAHIYPIHAKIAHNVLAIHISTVASESTFSTGEHVLDPFRRSLFLLTVDTLICTQGTLQ